MNKLCINERYEQQTNGTITDAAVTENSFKMWITKFSVTGT